MATAITMTADDILLDIRALRVYTEFAIEDGADQEVIDTLLDDLARAVRAADRAGAHVLDISEAAGIRPALVFVTCVTPDNPTF